VVLLLPLVRTYQSSLYEVILKYGGRDVSGGSLVFRCSKGNGAGRRATTSTIHKPKNFELHCERKIQKETKGKVPVSYQKKVNT
jgi:hypothetical protein